MTVAVDWSKPGAYELWQAQCEAVRAKDLATGKSAMDRALEEIAENVPPVVFKARADRDARRIEIEADRIVARPALLVDIEPLKPWSKPKTIIAVCEALLDQRNCGVSDLRLKGAIAYARRELAKPAEAA